MHRELKMYFEGNLVHSIFEPLGGSHLLTFKQGVTLHLYSSPIPRGRVYCEVTGKVAIREMSYDSVLPGAVVDGRDLSNGSAAPSASNGA